MATVEAPPILIESLPDHKQLPDKDGGLVMNFAEPLQSDLLTSAIEPWFHKLHPDGQFCIGRDNGIYWRLTDPPLLGCKSPDWYYVPGVPQTLKGEVRRSYVMWHEIVAPLLVLEYVSGDGSEERDQTPLTGKFWVYERGIRVPYYGIYEPFGGRLEVYQLVGGRYAAMAANERGHYLIAPMGVELGTWQGRFMNTEMPWLRWWDVQGNLLPTASERAEQLADRLRALGVDPDAVLQTSGKKGEENAKNPKENEPGGGHG